MTEGKGSTVFSEEAINESLFFLGVVSNHQCETQNQKRHKELQDLDHELRCLVRVVRGLLRWDVSAFCWDG